MLACDGLRPTLNPFARSERVTMSNSIPIKIIFFRTVLLVLMGVAMGGAVNLLRPHGAIPWTYSWSTHMEVRARERGIEPVTAEQMREQIESGEALVLDARSSAEFHAGAIPGAMSLPVAELDEAFPGMEPFLFHGQPIILYCSGLACDDALLLGEFLLEQGYTRLFLFAGGVEAWQAAGYPLEGGI